MALARSPLRLPGSAAPAAVVVRNKSQKYYSLARSPLRLPGSADRARQASYRAVTVTNPIATLLLSNTAIDNP